MAENSLIVGYLRAILTVDSAEYEAGVRKAADGMKALSKDLDKIGQQATDIGKTFTAAFTVPIVGAFAASSKAAIDFESSFAGVKKTVEATDAEFAAMADSLRGLAKEIPVNVNELNRLAEAAGALGIPKEEIVDFARVMAELGVTTNLTSDQAAEAIAKIQNIFNSAGEQTENFASSLVALGNAGASTESEILAMATRIAAAGNTIGLTQDEVLGLASAMASLGLEAEAGGTAMSRVFVDMAAAVSAGGVELQNFAAVSGMASKEFATLFREDSSQAVLAFIEGLGQIKEEGGDVLKVLADMGIEEVRLRDALLRLAGAQDQVREALGLSADAWRDNTALSEEARKRFETTEAQLTLLWNRIKDVGITLGNALLPMIQATIQAFNSFIPILEGAANIFASLPMPIQVASVAFAGLVAAIGPALIIFGQMAIGASSIAAAFGTTGVATRALTAVIPALTSAITGLGAAIGLTSGSVAAISGTLAGLGAAAAAAASAFVGWNFGKWLGEVTGLTDAFARLVTWLGELVRLMPEGSSQALKSIQELQEMIELNNEARSRGHDITLKSEAVEQKATTTRKQLTLVTEEQAKATEKAAAELKKLHDELVAMERSGSSVLSSMDGVGSAIGDVEIQLLDAAIAAGRMHEELVKIESLGRGDVPSSLRGIGDAIGDIELQNLELRLKEAREEAVRSIQSLLDLGDAFIHLGHTIGGSSGQVIAGIGGIIDGLATLKAAAADPEFKTSTITNLTAIVDGIAMVASATGQASDEMSTLNGAIAGAIAGMNPGLVAATGGASIGIGAAAGAIVGLTRSTEDAEEAMRRLAARELAEEFMQGIVAAFDEGATAAQRFEAGTNDAARVQIFLRDRLEDLGFSAQMVAGLLGQLSRAQREGPEAVQQALDNINDLLEEHESIMRNWAEGVDTFVEGFITRTDGFAQSMEGVTAATIESQEEFDRMGAFAVTAFSSLVEQTGSAHEALVRLREPINQLIAIQEALGFTGSATFQRLADISGVIQANESVFQSIQGLQQMMEGLQQATLLTAEDFRLFGEDAVSLFNQLIGNGVDANTAMSLMQPTLQMLWELQQKFGVAVDDGTRALLEQAEAAGIVGEEQRSVHEQILGVLLQIEDAIRRLPQAFAEATAEAEALEEVLGRVAVAREGGRADTSGGTAQTRHAGGILTAHTGLFFGPRLAPDEVPFIGLTGEAVLNRNAVAAMGGERGVNAFNRNPWAMPALASVGSGGGWSGDMSGGGGSLTIVQNISAPGGDPVAVGQAARGGVMTALEEIERGGLPYGKFRRLVHMVSSQAS